MIIILPIISIVIVVLTGSFLLRAGLSLYREKKAVSIFALSMGFIAYIVAALATRIVTVLDHGIMRAGLSSNIDSERWILLRQAIATSYGLVLMMIIVYLTLLVRKDLAARSHARSLFKESFPVVILALLLEGLEFVQNT